MWLGKPWERRSSNEAGPQPRRVGTKRQHGRKTSAVRHTTCCDHGQRRHRGLHRRHQRKGGYAPPDVAPCLIPLRHDGVNPELCSPSRLSCAANRQRDKRPSRMHALDVLTRVAPEERHHRDPLGERGIKLLIARLVQREIDSKRPIGQLSRSPHRCRR